MNASEARARRDAANLVLSGWSRLALAEDSLGNEVDPAGWDAASWCATGALHKACVDRHGVLAGPEMADRIAEEIEQGLDTTLQNWNDRIARSPEEVADLLRDVA